MTEFRLFDSPGADVAQIVTDGTTFKPFLNAMSHVADEMRLEVSEGGLSVKVVDPSNVFMGTFRLGADAFDTYEVSEEAELGIDVTRLKKLVRRARKNSTDELTLSVQQRELTATVGRGYDNHNVVSQGTMKLIDPESVRQSPELPSVNTPVSMELSTAALTDALSYAVGASECIELAVKGVNQHANALYIGGESDTRSESVAIDNIDTDSKASATFSKPYIADILAGINDVDSDTVRVEFGDQLPVFFVMNREDIPFRVEYAVAPRIKDT